VFIEPLPVNAFIKSVTIWLLAEKDFDDIKRIYVSQDTRRDTKEAPQGSVTRKLLTSFITMNFSRKKQICTKRLIADKMFFPSKHATGLVAPE
jgi:hypothetical protein